MKLARGSIWLLILLLISACAHSGQRSREVASQAKKLRGLFVTTFGSPKDPPIVYIHGGPGFNAKDFEVSTAEQLARAGFFVVSYDQRGQGRSDPAIRGFYNYRKYSEDLFLLIRDLKIQQPVLLAHSHGGPVAMEFQENFPNVARAIILVGAPVDFWKTMQSLVANCSQRYTDLNQLEALEDLQKNFAKLDAHRTGQESLVPALASLFSHGLFGCKLYQTKHPTKEELELRSLVSTSLAPMEQNSMPGFLVNESYVYQNHFPKVNKHQRFYFGIYGAEDGLFTAKDLEEISQATSKPRFRLVTGASHSVFLDQQKAFLEAVKEFHQAMPVWRAAK
jgi:proline iminopeptidase